MWCHTLAKDPSPMRLAVVYSLWKEVRMACLLISSLCYLQKRLLSKRNADRSLPLETRSSSLPECVLCHSTYRCDRLQIPFMAPP